MYCLPAPCSFQNIATTDFKGQGQYGKVQSWSHYNVAHLHLTTNLPDNYQLSISYSFIDIAYAKFLKFKVTMARSKVKSKSQHEIAHLQP